MARRMLWIDPEAVGLHRFCAAEQGRAYCFAVFEPMISTHGRKVFRDFSEAPDL
jgi:hypothetical protein